MQRSKAKILELLDACKHEAEQCFEESTYSKHHRKDLEGKLVAQVNELNLFQKALSDLERMHHSIRGGYEEDISRLKHELESRGIPVPVLTLGNNLGRMEHQAKRLKESHRRSGPPPLRTLPPRPLTPPVPVSQAPPQTQAQQQPQTQASQKDLVIHPRIQKANLNVEQIHCFEHSSVVCCVKFSPDGNYLATGCNHFAQIYEISSGRKILALVDESVPKQDDLYIRSVCFSPDGVYLATGAEDRIIRVWDIVNGCIKLKLVGHQQDIYSLDWTKDGKSIVSGSGDHTVKIWDAESGVCVRTFPNPSIGQTGPDYDKSESKDSGVTCLAIRPTDGRCVVAASLDETIKVWDLRTGHLLERFEGHENSVYSVAFAPDGLSIVSGSLDQSLRIWDLSPITLNILNTPPSGRKPEITVTRKYRHAFKGHRDYVLSVAYPGLHSTLGRVDQVGRPIVDPTFDIEWVVSGSKDRHVVFWDAKESRENSDSLPLLTMAGHKNSVISIAMGPTGGLFATGSGDFKARIWRVFRAPNAAARTSIQTKPIPTLAQDSPTHSQPPPSTPIQPQVQTAPIPPPLQAPVQVTAQPQLQIPVAQVQVQAPVHQAQVPLEQARVPIQQTQASPHLPSQARAELVPPTRPMTLAPVMALPVMNLIPKVEGSSALDREDDSMMDSREDGEEDSQYDEEPYSEMVDDSKN